MTSGPLGEPATAAANVFSRLIDYMPLPPLTEDGALAEAPSLEFTKVRLQTGIMSVSCQQTIICCRSSV